MATQRGVPEGHPGGRRRRHGDARTRGSRRRSREAMADPSLAAGGTTVFPGPACSAPATPTVAPATLVGQEVATFDARAVGDRHGHRRRTPRRSTAIAEAQIRAQRRARPPARRRLGRHRSRRRDRRRPDGQLPGDRHGPAGRDPRPGELWRRRCSASRSTRRARSSSRTARSSSRVWPDWVGVDPDPREPGRPHDRPTPSRSRRRPHRDRRRRDATACGIDLGRAADRPRARRRRRLARPPAVHAATGADLAADAAALGRVVDGARDRRARRRAAARGVRRRGSAGGPDPRLGDGRRRTPRDCR